MHANRRAPCQEIGAVFADHGPAYEVCTKARIASLRQSTPGQSSGRPAQSPVDRTRCMQSCSPSTVQCIRCAKFFSPRPDLPKNRLDPPAKPRKTVHQRKLRYRLIDGVAYFTFPVNILPSAICTWKFTLSKEPFLLTYRFSPKPPNLNESWVIWPRITSAHALETGHKHVRCRRCQQIHVLR